MCDHAFYLLDGHSQSSNLFATSETMPTRERPTSMLTSAG
jgi:hypothetical protein